MSDFLFQFNTDISCGSLCNPNNGWVNISVSSGPKLMANYACGAGYKIASRAGGPQNVTAERFSPRSSATPSAARRLEWAHRRAAGGPHNVNERVCECIGHWSGDEPHCKGG